MKFALNLYFVLKKTTLSKHKCILLAPMDDMLCSAALRWEQS